MTVRTVTAVFTDIVGSTALFETLSASRAGAVRTLHFEGLRSALHAHGGNEIKTLGDGMLAVFDSAGAALGWAGSIQRHVAAGQAEPRVAIRVGVASGDATEDGGDWHGTPIVEASRLCAEAGAGQVLTTAATGVLSRGSGHSLRALDDRWLKGMREATPVCELAWEPADDAVLRVVLADDAVLVRSGIAALLAAEGFEVAGQAGDADELLEQVARLRPDLVVADVRMPPCDHAGVGCAEEIIARHPSIGVLLLSTALEPRFARRLLAARPDRVGYMSKDGVADVEQFAATIRAIASGASVFDPLLGDLGRVGSRVLPEMRCA